MDLTKLNFYMCRAEDINIGKGVRIDGVRFCEMKDLSDVDIDANDLIVCSEERIDTSVTHSCFFGHGVDQAKNLPACIRPGAGLSDAVCRFANVLPEFYLEKARGRLSFLNLYPGAQVVLCLSYSYDYCVIVPSRYAEDGLSSDDIKRIEEELTSEVQPFAAYEPEAWHKLERWHNSILSRLNSQNVYKSNPNFREQIDIIIKLLDAEVKNSDEAGEYSLIASLLLYSMLIETRWRWASDSGELHFEETVSSDFHESVSRSKLKDLRRFISQSSPHGQWHDLIWSVIFISRGILATIMRRDKHFVSAERIKQHPYLKERDNFFGFLPIVSGEFEEICSYYHDHNSPKHNFGFLSIPQKNANSLWNIFPVFIHEFYHYIAPSYRTRRNEVVLGLTIHAVLSPLYKHLCPLQKWHICDRIHSYICVSAKFLSDILEPADSDQGNNIDSMYYLLKMQSLRIFDFEKFFDRAADVFFDEKDDEWLHDVREKCITLWRKDMISYLRTFTVALREIRSDISMYHFLWKGIVNDKYALARYIAILASEPGFAKTDSNLTAHSVILRFGFMTRYLVRRICQSADDRQFYMTWKDTVKEIIDRLDADMNAGCSRIASKAELRRMSHEKLNNLLGYIEEYSKIAIHGADEPVDKKMSSVFENLIHPTMYSNYSGSEEDLVLTWNLDVAEIADRTFPQELRKIYLEYEQASINNDSKKLLYMNYNSRLIFRRLFLYFENIDL